MSQTGTAYYTYQQLRTGSIDYADFIDTYAPCIVGDALWNDRGGNVVNACVQRNKDFNDLVSVSDEAFLVAAFINYHSKWTAEYENAEKKVSLVNASSKNVTCMYSTSAFHLEERRRCI